MRKTLRFMKRFGKCLLPVFAAYLVMLLCLTGNVWAYVYDDFTTSGIDPTKWLDIGNPTVGFFSQPGDGYLHFNSSQSDHQEVLLAGNFYTNPVTNPLDGAGSSFITTQFSDYSQNGTTIQPGVGLGWGSGICFGMFNMSTNEGYWVGRLGFSIDSYNLEMFQSWSVASDGSTTVLGYVLTSATDGMLGINYYDPSHISFSYNTGSGWIQISDVTATGWTTVPFLTIVGSSGDNAMSASFLVDNVQISPSAVPEPATMLLLGLGLMGTLGIKKKFRS